MRTGRRRTHRLLLDVHWLLLVSLFVTSAFPFFPLWFCLSPQKIAWRMASDVVPAVGIPAAGIPVVGTLLAGDTRLAGGIPPDAADTVPGADIPAGDRPVRSLARPWSRRRASAGGAPDPALPVWTRRRSSLLRSSSLKSSWSSSFSWALFCPTRVVPALCRQREGRERLSERNGIEFVGSGDNMRRHVLEHVPLETWVGLDSVLR